MTAATNKRPLCDRYHVHCFTPNVMVNPLHQYEVGILSPFTLGKSRAENS